MMTWLSLVAMPLALFVATVAGIAAANEAAKPDPSLGNTLCVPGSFCVVDANGVNQIGRYISGNEVLRIYNGIPYLFDLDYTGVQETLVLYFTAEGCTGTPYMVEDFKALDVPAAFDENKVLWSVKGARITLTVKSYRFNGTCETPFTATFPVAPAVVLDAVTPKTWMVGPECLQGNYSQCIHVIFIPETQLRPRP